MAVSYIGKSASFGSGTGTCTVVVAADYQEGDLLILICEGYDSLPALPSGWTNINTVSTAKAYVRVCYKVAGSSESSVVIDDSGDSTRGMMFAFRGQDTTTPIEASVTDSSSGTSFAGGALTSLANGAMIVCAIGFWDGDVNDSGNFSSWANTSLESVTEAYDYHNSTGSGGGIACAYGIDATAGSVNDFTATGDSADIIASIVAFAIKPLTATNATITGVPAPAVAGMNATALAVGAGITGIPAPAVAAMLSAAVSATQNTVITGSPAVAAAAMLAATLAAVQNTTINGQPAPAVAAVLSAAVTAVQNASIIGIPAPAIAAMLAAAVTAVQNAEIDGVPAAAAAAMLAAAVTAVQNATINGSPAAATAGMNTVSVSAVQNVEIAGVPAPAAAGMLAAMVSAGISASITGLPAPAAAAMLAASVAAVQNASIAGIPVAATAAMLAASLSAVQNAEIVGSPAAATAAMLAALMNVSAAIAGVPAAASAGMFTATVSPDGYYIERKAGSGGEWAEIAIASASPYDNSADLVDGVTYYYRVRRRLGGVFGDYSNEAYVEYQNEESIVGVPAPASAGMLPAVVKVSATITGLAAAATAGQIAAILDIAGYHIERKTGVGGTWEEIAIDDASPYNDESEHTSGITYYYRVRRYFLGAFSDYSNEAYVVYSSGSVIAGLVAPAAAGMNPATIVISAQIAGLPAPATAGMRPATVSGYIGAIFEPLKLRMLTIGKPITPEDLNVNSRLIERYLKMVTDYIGTLIDLPYVPEDPPVGSAIISGSPAGATAGMLAAAVSATRCVTITGKPAPAVGAMRIANVGKYYYVAKTGSDSNAGTLAAPFLTIQKAADVVAVGDTVLIRTGTYNEAITCKASGSAGQYITFKNYDSEVVTIDGTGFELYASRKALFDTAGKHYIIIDGLRVIHSTYFGIGDMAGSTSGGSHIIVRNCYTYDTGGCGIAFFWGSYIYIYDNEVDYSCVDGYQEAISLHGIDTFEIYGNEVHDGLKEGIDPKGGSKHGLVHDNYVHDMLGGEWDMNGIYCDAYEGIEYDIEVWNNTVERCGNGIIVGAENNGECYDIYIHDNDIIDCRAGFNVSGWGIGESHTVHDIRFEDNFVRGAADNAVTWSNAMATNIEIRRNTLGCRYTESDPIEMTNGVTSIDPSNVIDSNELGKLGTKSTALNGTNYTILPKAATPVLTVDGNTISYNTALEHEIYRSSTQTGTYALVAKTFDPYVASAGWYKARACDGYRPSDLSAAVQIT